jgi:hypothetical protein
VVKKSSFLEKLRHRWKTGAGVQVSKPVGRDKVPEPVQARIDGRIDRRGGVAAPVEAASSRKLSAREEAVSAITEGFADLSSLVRGVQARVEDSGARTGEIAGDVKVLPALARAQLETLQRLAAHLQRQGEVNEQLLVSLGGLPDLLSGVQAALDRVADADHRTAQTLEDFRTTMDRIEGAMEQMVDSARAQADATTALSRDHRAEQEEIVAAIRQGREEDVQTLVQTQREGVERIESATSQRLEVLRKMQEEHAAHIGKLVTANGKWTQVVVVLLALTFFAIAGILAVLGLR